MNTFITTDIVAQRTARLIAEAEESRLAKSFRKARRAGHAGHHTRRVAEAGKPAKLA